MYATFGEVQLPHFRHNGDKCQHSKYLHDLAEHVFNEEYTKCLDEGLPFYLELRIPQHCNEACVLKKHANCKEHYIQKTVDLTKEYTLISLEARVDLDERYRRPDILLESLDGKQLWVEIWVSHETEEEKREDGRIIEIKIETEKDLDKIRQHKILQSEGEDLAVRIFSIDADGTDALFTDEEDLPITSYPCEHYFCFEAGKAVTIPLPDTLESRPLWKTFAPCSSSAIIPILITGHCIWTNRTILLFYPNGKQKVLSQSQSRLQSLTTALLIDRIPTPPRRHHLQRPSILEIWNGLISGFHQEHCGRKTMSMGKLRLWQQDDPLVLICHPGRMLMNSVSIVPKNGMRKSIRLYSQARTEIPYHSLVRKAINLIG